MKVKIEFDLGEAARLSRDPIYDTASRVLESLSLEISEPGALEGDVNVYVWRNEKREPVKVGSWEVA